MGRPDVKRDPSSVYRGGKDTSAPGPGPRRVTSMPGVLSRMLQTTGGGSAGQLIDRFQLVPKLAYLAVMGADGLQGSEHQTVVAKLDEPGPTFTVRPLPIVEGERVPNTGVQFKKDPEFMALFLVERGLDTNPPVPADEALDKDIRKWLSPPLREALLELPDAWLRVDGKAKAMAFTVYGFAHTERIEELLAAADIVFAEYGAGGGPSLLGDDDEEEEEAEGAAKSVAKPKLKSPKPDGKSPRSDGRSDGKSARSG